MKLYLQTDKKRDIELCFIQIHFYKHRKLCSFFVKQCLSQGLVTIINLIFCINQRNDSFSDLDPNFFLHLQTLIYTKLLID